MNKKLVKQQEHIPMERFLRDYVRVENEIVIDTLSGLTHHDLKLVCEEVYGIRVSRLPLKQYVPKIYNMEMCFWYMIVIGILLPIKIQ